MNPILRNILAVLAGFITGNVVNRTLVIISHSVIPQPAGVDVTTLEGLKASMHLLEGKHFVFPFLAHALGTLAGALVAALLAASHKMRMALIIGLFFLVGGIMVNVMLSGPLWFTVVDIALAYLPMAFLGGKWGGAKRKVNA